MEWKDKERVKGMLNEWNEIDNEREKECEMNGMEQIHWGGKESIIRNRYRKAERKMKWMVWNK